MTSKTSFTALEIPQRIALLRQILDDSIKNVTLHPVRLELVWKKLCIDVGMVHECVFNDEYDFEVDVDSLKLGDWTWDTVLFPECNTLHVFSTKTGNKDIRGGVCGDADFSKDDFHWTIKTPEGITLKHLTEGVYRMKGSKYDYWYELFNSVKLVHRVDDGWLTLEVKFDYDS